MAIDVSRVRDELLEKRERVAHALEYLHKENPGSMEDETEESPIDNHLAETASVTLDREIDYTLEEIDEQVLVSIDEAIARIDNGTYGICDNCGQRIGEERLRAIPWATLCIDCKRLQERR
ncbi:MAG TPA: TraR/DksA C4-type zinc finger protein [Gaiellaceae bacterium]|nr:TraR/DksA C4-type zinc finger protein [Gaiellaceae bacterium]